MFQFLRFQLESNVLKATYQTNFGNFMFANRLQANRGHENVSIFRFQLESNLLKATYKPNFGKSMSANDFKLTAEMKIFQFFAFN